MDQLRWEMNPPKLRDPMMVCAFRGWNDAASAASSALETLADSLEVDVLAEVDPVELVRAIVDNARRGGQAVAMTEAKGEGRAMLRVHAVTRAVENLIGNAVRYGRRAEVCVTITDKAVRISVDDDGPGIPQDRRDEALRPFTRLDAARDPNRGGGVGLGLSIAADIARSHGGQLRLGESERLGGLKVDLVLAR